MNAMNAMMLPYMLNSSKKWLQSILPVMCLQGR